MIALKDRNEFARVINDRGYKTIAEIGIAHGLYANVLLGACPGILKYYGIDPFDGHEQHCPFSVPIENLARYGTKVALIREQSAVAVSRFNDSYFDFVYIDGDHAYNAVKQDLELYWPKIRVGGMLAGHDYHYSQPGVIKAVDEFAASRQLVIKETGLIGEHWQEAGLEFTVPSWFIEKEAL